MLTTKLKFKPLVFNQLITMFAFSFVGAATFVLYILVFSVLTKWLHLDYWIAVSIAYPIAITFHFFSNRNLVFKANGNLQQQIIKYISILFINYLITLFIMYIIISVLKLSPYLGIVIAAAITMISNYFLFKYWTFSVK